MASRIYDCVYVVQCNEFYKIGISLNPELRVKQFETSNPYDLKIIRIIEVRHRCRDVEEYLHWKLRAYRHRLEWFKLPPEQVEWLLTAEDIIDRARSWQRLRPMRARLGYI